MITKPFAARLKGQIPATILSVANNLTGGGSKTDVGKPMVVSANDTFTLAADDGVFVGFVDSVKPGVVGLKAAGLMENVPYVAASAPTLGLCMLVAGADGKVKKTTTAPARLCTVVSLNATDKTCTFYF